jgi:hypothetical protein
MRKGRFTEEQIIKVLKATLVLTPPASAQCRKTLAFRRHLRRPGILNWARRCLSASGMRGRRSENRRCESLACSSMRQSPYLLLRDNWNGSVV